MSGFAPPPKVPVAEVFGPTIQGEGPLAGMSTFFVRFGGCDYLCEWCDSLHAVLPEHVRGLPRLTPLEVVAQLGALDPGPEWVTLSGGNPAMFKKLGPFVDALHAHGYKLSIETQGSKWQDWLRHIDQIVVSPKPPSSGMVSPEHERETELFMANLRGADAPATAVKIVVFTDDDYDWAVSWLSHYDDDFFYDPVPRFISCGTDSQGEERIEDTLSRYGWLCERVAHDSRMSAVRVLPQLHVLAWGHALGV